MKRHISVLLLCTMLIAVFSVTLSLTEFESNPFEYYDELRKESIAAATGARPTVGSQASTANEKGYIVKFKDSADLDEIYDCVSGFEFKLLADSHIRLFKLCTEDIKAFKRDFGDIIETVEAEGVLSLSAVVDDPLALDQWELDYLDAYSAWDITTGNNDVTVAVLDSGVYRMHPDFEGVSILAGYDAVDRVNVVNLDHNGHGTKVISIIAAAANNGQGMAGLGRNVSIMPIRVSDYTGYVHSADFIDAVYYAADAGVDIINMSFGGYSYSATEEAAMEYASSKGCLLISAAGNKETDAQYAGMKAYPASYSSVISVGAIDESGMLCSFSQRNDAVDVVAPGFNITVANMDGGYEKELGTSFAAAYVSAIAALALSAIDEGISFTADQLVSLVAHLSGNRRTDGYGYGAINALSVLSNINTPLVSGVTDGGVYHNNVSITFNRGNATLDGKPFYSGESVITSGSHSLVLTDGEYVLQIDFITDNIPLKYEYKETASSAYITFSRGNATLDGAPYSSGTAITADGRHFFVLTGPYGNTETFEFECDFTAPAVFGVENGKQYTTPVMITAERGAVLSLNGTGIQSGTVISKNGAYVLVSASADGSKKKAYNFTVNLKDVNTLSSAVSGSKLIADDTYNTIILYNNALSGIRVFPWGNLTRTKCFIRTDSGVTGYGFYGKKLVLMNRYGITLCDRERLAAGNTDGTVDYSFDKEAIASCYLDGYVYYLSSDKGVCVLYRMDVKNGKSKVLTTAKEGVRLLCAESDRLFVAGTDGEIYIYTTDGELKGSISTGTEIHSIVADNGYVCTDGFVYLADSKEKLFSLPKGERPLFAKNKVLVTNHSVYSLVSGERIAAFGEGVVDCVLSEKGYAVKSFSDERVEIVNNEDRVLSPAAAARILNAALCNKVYFGEITPHSEYESYAIIPEGTDVSASVLVDKMGLIFAVSATQKTLYHIDCKTLQVKEQTALRYEPAAVCCDGNMLYISFKNENRLYSYSLTEDTGSYYSCAESFVKLLSTDGALYALDAKGNLCVYDTARLSSRGEWILRGQNVIDFALDGSYLYVYLKPVSLPMLYIISRADNSVTESAVINANTDKIFVTDGGVIVGNKAYSKTDLTSLYTLSEQARYAYGKYIISDKGLYLSADGSMISRCRVDLSFPMFAADYSYYSIEPTRISVIRNVRKDLDSLPNIKGIRDGAVLDGPAYIEFDFGKGFLDNLPYTEGLPVENGGLHSFVVSLPFGVNATVQFTINADINYIVLYAQKNTLRVNEHTKLSVNANPPSYGVVDVVYSTDNGNVIVLPDGSVIAAAEGESIVTATTADGKHKSEVKITVTKGFIEFDSSYFFADTTARIIKGISSGTDVEAFLNAASQTKGTLVVRAHNGVAVSAGMIHTGMTAELLDIYNNVIDEWYLSVLGDIDGDGFITANDYYELEYAISHADGLTAIISSAADIDSNGRVNSFDLLALKEHLLGQRDIGDSGALPTRVAGATAHIIMPGEIAPDTSFTATLTLSDMKGLTALSGVLNYDSSVLNLKELSVVGKRGGFYTETPDGVFFFTDIGNNAETAITLLAVFHVSAQAKPEEDSLAIDFGKLTAYDGSAATVNGISRKTAICPQAKNEVLIHNLPAFIFDDALTENRIVLPADTQRIYVSAYPMENGDIAGDREFGNRLNASFAVVFNNAEDNISQYNFNCERSEVGNSSTGTEAIYKNSNNYIAELIVEGGSISPAFDKSVEEYYVLTDAPDAVKVSATAESVLSSVEVLPINRANSQIAVKCTAEDGSVRLYTLNVCTKLPIEYAEKKQAAEPVWLWCIPALALAAIAACLIIYNKKGRKQNSVTEIRGAE